MRDIIAVGLVIFALAFNPAIPAFAAVGMAVVTFGAAVAG